MGRIAYDLFETGDGKKSAFAYAESHELSYRRVIRQFLCGFLTVKSTLPCRSTTRTTPKLSRPMALHRGEVYRAPCTMGLGGEAYLNFMGNEFGHPEWIDFPREEMGLVLTVEGNGS